MAKMYELCLDLKQWPAGGWQHSKTRAKVNGRWIYFFDPEHEEPWNSKEPVDFSTPYTPPNHQHEAFAVYPEIPTHPVRQPRLRDHDRPKPPLSRMTASRAGHFVPLASSQKVETFTEREPPIWKYRPFISGMQARSVSKTASVPVLSFTPPSNPKLVGVSMQTSVASLHDPR
jgi:hypothetical protein